MSFDSATAELHQVWEQPNFTAICIDAKNPWVHALNSEHVQNALCLFADAHWLELIHYTHYCVCAYTLGEDLF